MIERDPKIVKSGLSRTVKKEGVTVEVSIVRLEHETEWFDQRRKPLRQDRPHNP